MDISDVKDALEQENYQLSPASTPAGQIFVKDFPGDKFYNEVYLDLETNKAEFNRYNYNDTLLAYDAFAVTPGNARLILGRISRK